MYAMPPYPYLATDYGTQLSLSLTTFGLVVSVLVLVRMLLFLWFVITTLQITTTTF
jgi:hypothetical protein